ncbi:TonB-dependent Receptor Plug Domain [Dyella jiangningensis]|uniref:TonB-dependent receptor domain-containing protein n=1 Tax=Dyella sp. AtDHG13 TaxID=1938897 RepID=UPI000887AC40|nr:TonB-dependent receptor [Dyella sp. AtDHG13]PXV53281.1 TonB-dependent receptor-like protein [Dyella sp. AtDHG13]SDL35713.1 TonB-dependent Receptor Plug Domain [Dyella jiangningensis]
MLKSKLTVAVLAAMALAYSHAYAATATPDPQDTSSSQDTAQSDKAKKLEAVTVTGSLIPQSQIETSAPVTTITAEDMKVRGFNSVAEALQQSSFATGSVQGASTSASFTQGAQTLSIFGLPVGFVKYLIDGRPLGNFPALYNGSDSFNNLSGIPMDMVDHIDILPGGQSSLYGSDAIAGVINIVLKKKIDAPTIDARYGWYSGGGGADRRISFADSWNVGKLNILAGGQFESSQPIWAFDRDLTKQYFTKGTSAATASRDFLVYSPFSGHYYFEDPDNCSNTTSLFHGTEGLQHRSGGRTYCGTFYSPGYRTLKNDAKTANVYTHATFDVNENLQLYGDFLYNYQEQKFTSGAQYTWWGSSDFGNAFYDPNLDDFVSLQRAFAPEEVGGFHNIMDKQTENSYMLTLGAKGTFGQSNWDYDLGFTHSDDKLEVRNFDRFAGAMDAYFQKNVLGPQQGLDPYYNSYPVFSPNYANFYKTISPADFKAMTGYTTTNAKTWDNMIRGQVTNSSLFVLPGGDAGIAVVAEGGNQGWSYVPDQRLLDGDIWGRSDVQGGGHRSRYALTTELRLPLLNQLTLDAAGRYDSYSVDGHDVSHGTYNLGLEYRPFESLLLRGRYGTAFKVPTLSDEFQGESGYYAFVPDYLNCARLGHSPADIANCPAPYDNTQYHGEQSGNTALKPITANVWSYGFVWSPVARMSFSVDYYHYNITNEVAIEDADKLSQAEYLCDIGTLDKNSPTCANAFAKITRNISTNPALLGQIQSILTPKVNVASERDNALVAEFSYGWSMGSLGNMSFDTSYSDVLKHQIQQYPGDPLIDVLRHPYYSTDFKTKVNGSLTWTPNDQWSGTVYFNRYGSTPNYLATVADNYTVAGTGRLAPWIIYNASVTYNPIKNLGLSFLVNNVFNKMPPEDHSYPGTTASAYNDTNYNVYGRAYYVEANYKF